MLPILMVADLAAIAYFRRRAHWHSLVRLLPPTFVGIVIGYFALRFVAPAHVNRLIAAIVLALLILQFLRELGLIAGDHIPHQWWFAVLIGLFAGSATMIANAAGPITVLFFLAIGLSKLEFLGTAAWFYFIVNWLKVPFQTHLGFITPQTLLIDAVAIPPILLGAFLGGLLHSRIPQTPLHYRVLALAAVAAGHLLITG